MNFHTAWVFVLAIMGTCFSGLPLKWLKVLVLLLLGLLFTVMALLCGFGYMWEPQIATLWVAGGVGTLVLAGISYLACVINVCILE